MTETDQQLLQLIVSAVIGGVVGNWVIGDAKRRGLKDSTAFNWGVSMFLATFPFLLLYLYLRKRNKWGTSDQPKTTTGTKECPYCGYLNTNNVNYCAKCDRQLKSSNDIHHKKS